MNRQNTKLAVVISAALLLLAGVVWAQDAKKAEVQSKPATSKAIAVLHPTEGNKVHGWVTFYKEGNNVKVTAHIEGLAAGKHGFHIHEYGDCSSKDGMAAGGHYNPMNKPHAAREDANRHTGDLGNVEVGADGIAHLEFNDPTLKFDGPSSILGLAVIVHAQPDDLKSQPAGNAGARQACGVIGAAKP